MFCGGTPLEADSSTKSENDIESQKSDANFSLIPSNAKVFY